MKKSAILATVVLSLVLLTAISITAFAAGGTEGNLQAALPFGFAGGHKMPAEGAGGFAPGLPPGGERPELTDEQKAEMTAKAQERLEQLLEEGKITQEQYEQGLADIAEGKMPMHFGRGMGNPAGEWGECL